MIVQCSTYQHVLVCACTYEVVLGARSGKRIKWFSTANCKFSLPSFPSRLITLVMRPLYVRITKRCFFDNFNERVFLSFFENRTGL